MSEKTGEARHRNTKATFDRVRRIFSGLMGRGVVAQESALRRVLEDINTLDPKGRFLNREGRPTDTVKRYTAINYLRGYINKGKNGTGILGENLWDKEWPQISLEEPQDISEMPAEAGDAPSIVLEDLAADVNEIKGLLTDLVKFWK